MVFYQDFILNFGYFAVFLLALARGAGMFGITFPVPTPVVIAGAVGLGLNPFLTGVIVGVASTIGDSIGYFVGLGSNKLIARQKKMKIPKIAMKLKRIVHKSGFWVVMLVGLTPLPFDIFGIACGLARYDLKKFLLASLIGKVGGALMFAYAAPYGIDLLKAWLSP